MYEIFILKRDLKSENKYNLYFILIKIDRKKYYNDQLKNKKNDIKRT